MRDTFGADDVLGEGAPRWPAVLERLCAMIPGACAISRLDGGRRTEVLYHHGTDEAALARWTRHLSRSDATRSALRAGDAVKVSLPHARGRLHALAAALGVDRDVVSLVHLRHEGGPHGAHDDSRFRALLRELRRAWSVEEHLARIRYERDRAQNALDLAPLALVTVDAALGVLHANALARQLLAEERETLAIQDGRLVAGREADRAPLRSTLRAAIGGRSEMSTVALARPRGRRPLVITARRIPGTVDVLLFVTDPETPPVQPATLQALFSLTTAEARLAVALMQGQTVDGAAAEFGTSVHTVRSQLRRLFQKTHTSRQSELVRLLLASLRGF